MGIRVGIDLGTTFSLVAKIDEVTGKPCIIPNSDGSNTTPSVLHFLPDGGVVCGQAAKDMQAAGDVNTAAFFKRAMGNPGFAPAFYGRRYSAPQLSGLLLGHLKAEAEARTGQAIDGAVITVPAYFTQAERQATLDAGRMAGLNVLSIINEPTAAAFAYGLAGGGAARTLLVYDLGGGTFDVTIAQVDDDRIQILGSDGNHELGGKDWDDCIARYLAGRLQEQYGLDVGADEGAVASLLVAAESVKRQLTARDAATVNLRFGSAGGPVEVTRATFEDISAYLMGATQKLTEGLLAQLGLGWADIDGVVLVGGSTRMPMVRDYVTRMSGRGPMGGLNPDEAVALGAAIRANIDEEGRPATLPGQAGALPRIAGARAVSDVTAHSLGMISESSDRQRYINKCIIAKNSPIPAAASQPFLCRPGPGGGEVEVYVMQGEHKRPLDNTLLNKFVISGVRPVKGPTATVDVTYRYTADGLVQVEANQRETGAQLAVRAEPVPDDMAWTDQSPMAQAGGQHDVILAIDLSGSMMARGVKTKTAMGDAKLAMQDFLAQMAPLGTRVGVVGFADKAMVHQPPTADYAAAARAIETVDDCPVGGGTSGQPFTVSLPVLTACSGQKTMVVLTDGEWFGREAAIHAARKCHGAGIQVIALGFGSADHAFLKQIASAEGLAAMTSLTGLSGSFSKIAQAIDEGTGLIRL